jgi:type VI secretion system secreted protein Hcp
MGTRHSLRFSLIPLAAAAAFAPMAHADHVFLQIPGIPGESVADRYKDWIDLTSFGQEFNRRTCGGITFSKYLDKASARLAVSAVNGDVLAQATVAVIKDGDTRAEYLRLVLTDAIVASVTIQSADPTHVVTESLRLVPRSVTITYRQQDAKGGLGPEMTTVVTCNRQR